MRKRTITFFYSTALYYTLFLGAVFLWCLLIIAAPMLAHWEVKVTSGVIYFFFSKICHQIPERSFFIYGKQFAVCSRCSGLYFGFLLGTIIYPLIYQINSHRIPATKYFYFALVPITIDIFVRFFQIAENTFLSRFSTGLILGVTTVFFILPGFLSRKKQPKAKH